jgi:hypothetical protein
LNANLTKEAVEREGTDVNILINAAVACAEECIGQLIGVTCGQFLTSSERDILSRLIFDRYSLIKNPAAPALGTVVFRTATTTIGSFSIPENTVVQTSDGRQYITTLATSFPASSTGPVFVPIRSVLAGANQQAAIGTITSIVSQIPSSPLDLTCSNELATAGASDEESDPQARERARRFWVSARKGTLGAIETQALSVPGVVSATAIEVLDALGRPGRLVQLIITDTFTEALATLGLTDPTYEAQSQTLATQVFQQLADTRAGGIFVQVIVGQIVILPILLQLTFTTTAEPDVTALRARARVVNFVNELAPGESFDPEKAVIALSAEAGLLITGNEIAIPAGIVVPQAVQVLRTTLSTVNAVAVQTSQPVALTTNPDQFIISGQ